MYSLISCLCVGINTEHLLAQNVHFCMLFYAKTYNLDLYQCLKCTHQYVFLVKKLKNISVSIISLRYSYQCIFYNFMNMLFRFLGPLPQT